jgi:hypothetical protein
MTKRRMAASSSCFRNERPCGVPSRPSPSKTLEEVVTRYLTDWRQLAARDMRPFKKAKSLSNAISEATAKYPHQYRIPNSVLEEAKIRLLKRQRLLEDSQSFDELHYRIECEIGSIHGIGELAIYDIAHRIGSYLGLEPKRVYLHAGTRHGARALGLSGKKIHPQDLPQAFRQLTAAEIEDCLCIYAEDIARLCR